MRVLVACEESQVVCTSFRVRGHDAYSCDLLPCSGPFPEYHIQADAREVNKIRWDLVIAHPPCDHLAVSGARWFGEKRKDGRQQAAIEFFMDMVDSNAPMVAVENPVSIMSTVYRKPDQAIQPWQFGHTETKKTCLWLTGLPPLIETDNVHEEFLATPKAERERIWRMPPGPDRARMRSQTYLGIALAMAEQWGNLGVYSPTWPTSTSAGNGGGFGIAWTARPTGNPSRPRAKASRSAY